MRFGTIAACAALALGAGCGLTGEDERSNAVAVPPGKAGAEGKAEEGRLSIKAPGVDIAINVPQSMRSRARAGADSDVLPPGAAVSGIHVEGDGGEEGPANDSVELRFVVERPVGEVAAWYRDPARAQDFTIASVRREGEELVLSGTSSDGGGPMTVRLRPHGATTEGRLILVDRD